VNFDDTMEVEQEKIDDRWKELKGRLGLYFLCMRMAMRNLLGQKKK
jgi:hypothetical protein